MRIWTTCKEAGRPFPVLDEDDVIDFQIAEAVVVKVAKEREEQQKKQERKEWRKDQEGIDRLKEITGQA
jgi:hypothetical protein